MADISVTKNSFTGGEWAPSLHDRFDLAKYPSAVKSMKNAFCHAHGPASNRGGTMFVGEVKTSANRTRLWPFQFSVVQNYMLEFGDQYIRFYKDRSRIFETGKVPSAITKANPGVVTSVGHGFNNGDWVQADDIGGMVELEGRMFKVANKTADTFELQDVDGNNVNTTAYTTFTSGGTFSRVYTVTSPYALADLPLLKFEQSADVLYIFHPSYDERQLTRTGHTSWTLTATTYASGVSAPTSFARSAGAGTGKTFAVTAVTDDGEESVPSSTAAGGDGDTFGWVAPAGTISHYNFYQVEDGLYKLLGAADGLTFVVPTAEDPDASLTAPKAKNPFSGANNRPGVGAFFQQRMVRGRTNNFPQSLFGSVTGSFNNHNVRTPVRDDDAFKFTINSRQVNEIRALVALDELIVLTAGAEWKVSAGSQADAVGPLSVKIEKQSQYGASDLPPLVIGGTILFVDFSKQVVRDLLYSLEVDKYAGNDLSILANHLMHGYELEEWAHQAAPDSIVWAVRDDGVLLGMTYHREHQVFGWHHHETDGRYESVASIPDGEGGVDTYIIVRRVIGSTVRRFVEVMKDRLPSSDPRDAYFVDCGLSLDDPKAITGVTAANPVVVTVAGHGWSNGDRVDLSEIEGSLDADDESQLNGKQFVIRNKTTNTFELEDLEGNAVNGSTWSAYIEGGYARKAVTTISGLHHLAGEAVAVLSNGNVITGKTVSADGKITLTNPASRVHVGLAYDSEIELLDFIYETRQGTVRDKLRWINSVILGLQETRALWVGPSADRLIEVKFRDAEDYSAPIELFTGNKEVLVEAAEDHRSSGLLLKNTQPLPFTVGSVTATMSHGES